MAGPVVARLADGRRLHMQHGPMDLVVRVDGDPAVRDEAERRAVERFRTILEELVDELSVLRSPLTGNEQPDDHVTGAVARRMVAAAAPMADVHVTPMIAVAGSVADEVAAAIATVEAVSRATVNNGGDLAVVVRDGQHVVAGLVDNLRTPKVVQRATLHADGPSRGMATSGRDGRSLSRGIADAVTVVAASAAAADAAATLVANAVDIDHPGIERAPAVTLDPDSDLGDLPVTVAVPELPTSAVRDALAAGLRRARQLLHEHPDLHGVTLSLQGQRHRLGTLSEDTSTTDQPPTPPPGAANAP